MNTSEIRVVFFGTPEFAVDSLIAVHKAGYHIVAVVTQPDKPVGRKQLLTASPVKQYAQSQGIPVLQPKTLKREKPSGEDFFQHIQALKPDIAIVVAYGKIIPESYLSVPRHGYVNVHGSLLPDLRGPSPIHTAILNGLTRTGVTIMQLDAGMDTGAMLSQESIDILPTDTTQTLHDSLKSIGANLLVRTLPGYMNGAIQPQPQENSQATYCHLINKEDGFISFSDDPHSIDRKIRAYTPWPGAWCVYNEKRIKLLAAHCVEDTLSIDRVQPEGKKPMLYSEYLKGNPPLI